MTLNFIIDTFLEFIRLSYWIHLVFSLNNNRKNQLLADFCFLTKAVWRDQMCLGKNHFLSLLSFSSLLSAYDQEGTQEHEKSSQTLIYWESMPGVHLVSSDLIKPTLFPLYFWQRIVFGDLAFCSFLASSQHLSKKLNLTARHRLSQHRVPDPSWQASKSHWLGQHV